MVSIAASILSADFARLGEQAREAEAAGADVIHADIMDGRFVPPISFGADVVRALRRSVSLPLGVHLMVVEPERHLAAFAEAGASRLIVHAEACRHLHRTLQSIHDLHLQAGVAINPGTPLTAVEEVLDVADQILIMTVNPGFGGQAFIPGQVDKISRLRRLLEQRGLAIPIAVDGGIHAETATAVVKAGATILVAGSSIFNTRASVAQNVAALRAVLTDAQTRGMGKGG
jgi:ribulose-phosphate 3-epimerase